MNKNVLIAFGGAIIMAILVAVMMSALLKGGRKEKTAEATVPSAYILVAAKDIGIGAALSTENTKWKSWPADSTFSGTIVREDKQKVSDVAKGRVIRGIAADEPILKNTIVGDEGSFLAAKLPKGMRAMAVNTKANTLAGGFINPGDFVDVVLTYSLRVSASSPDADMQQKIDHVIEMNLNRFASETVLRNVKVLGIDQRAEAEEVKSADSKDKSKTAKVGKTATLEVDERGAEILSLAQKMGDITLVLRPLGDEDTKDTGLPSVSDARLISLNKELSAELTRVEEEGGSNNKVRIYSGGVTTNIPVR